MPFLAPVAAWLVGGSLLAKVVVGVGLSVVSTLIGNALRPKQPEQRDPGVNLSMRLGGNEPLSFFVGLGATAGHRAYAGTWGHVDKTPNAYFVDVLELANAPVDGLNGVYVNGERGAILWDESHAEFGYPIAQGRVSGKDHLWVKFYDGRQSAPDPYLRTRFGGHADRPYEADMVGRGTPYAIVTTLYNREHWQNGAPQMLFELRGMRFYDIRRDSSAGGAGSQRRNDPTTWQFTQNPWVIAYNIAFMGVYVGDEWLWGLQHLPPFRLPASAWIAAMNEADRQLGAWGNVAQFQIGGEITVDMEPAAVLEEIAKSSAGRLIESGGFYKPRCGAPASSLWSFGEGQMHISEPRTFTPFPGLEATHNTVEATYSEPAETWGTKAAPVKTNAAYIAADDNRRLVAGLTFPMVSRNEQVQRLAYTYLEDGRRFRQLQAWFHPISWVFEPGDVIDGTILHEGYNGKNFEIIEMQGRRSAEQRITLREIDPGDFDAPISSRQDWSVSPITVVPPPAQMMVGWQVEPAALKDEQGRDRRPSIKVTYSGDQDDVDQVEVTVRIEADNSIVFNGRLPYGPIVDSGGSPITVKSTVLNGVFLPNTLYEVQGRFIPFSARPMLPSLWLPVVTPNIRLGDDDVYLPGMVAEIIEQVGEITEFADYGAREHLERIRQMASVDAAAAGHDHLESRLIKNEVSLQIGETKSFVSDQIYLAVGPESAIVARLNEQRAEYLGAVAGAQSLISTEVSRVDNRITAEGNRIDTLVSEVAGIESRFTMRAQTVASPGGGVSRWVVQVQAGSPGSYVSSSLFLEADSSGIGSAGFMTNRFFIIDPSNPSSKATPFVFQDGAARMNNAFIRGLTSENIDVSAVRITSSLQLDPGVVVTGAIQADAITAYAHIPATSFPPWPWDGVSYPSSMTFGSYTITSESGKPILVFASIDYSHVFFAGGAPGGPAVTVTSEASIVVGGASVSIGTNTISIASGSTGTMRLVANGFMFWVPPAPGTYTVSLRIQYFSSNATPNTTVVNGQFLTTAQSNKR